MVGNPMMLDSFRVAERGTSSRLHLIPLRWALVIVFVWFGAEKFTAYAAEGIAPLISHSPIVSWLQTFGVRGESEIIGTIELTTAVLLVAGAFYPLASALGAAMSCGTFLITMSFFLSTPGIAEASAGGFPVISTLPGQFLLKDIVLFSASLALLIASVPERWVRVS
jgi:uncharacterized membrane protein YkgB